jgi:CTP synthase (UTP-ammonia lyase)
MCRIIARAEHAWENAGNERECRGAVVKSIVRVGLIGDFDSSVPAHQAIPLALKNAGEQSGVQAAVEWVPTDEISSTGRLSRFDGIWCVPASPYRSMDGALLSIRYARENQIPFLGTCGGFQHAVIEYARNVLGWSDAEHAETSPEAHRAVISPLECALVEATDSVRLLPGTRIARAYGATEITAEYRCRYGLNNEFRAALTDGPLRVAAQDRHGDVRAIELDGNTFFIVTLFQPERAALRREAVPLAVALVEACAAQYAGRRTA